MEDGATKEQSGRTVSVHRLRTLLFLRAQTGDPAAAADILADFRVFDAAGELIHTGGVAFNLPEDGAGRALRVWGGRGAPRAAGIV